MLIKDVMAYLLTLTNTLLILLLADMNSYEKDPDRSTGL